ELRAYSTEQWGFELASGRIPNLCLLSAFVEGKRRRCIADGEWGQRKGIWM
ncbi:unnamed protein product, partial [Musa acuminata subsp. burmannicoides]